MIDQKFKYPIGIQTFADIRQGGYLYVDKTGYVYHLAQRYRYVFLSRPRRFGKSLLVSTMKSYFEGRRDLFEGLSAGQMETEWRQHPVLHISLATAKGGSLADMLATMDRQLGWLEKHHGITPSGESPGLRLESLIRGCAEKYGERVVVLIDEYDAPLLSVLHHGELLEDMRYALRAFFSPLKDCDPWLRFVFITGVSKFSQLSIFSELNNLRRITMDPQYSAICGISEQELHSQWHEAVAGMAERIGITADEAYHQLKEHYDGYHFAKDMTDVYNPFSLLMALDAGDMRSHWFETGTPSVLVEMLKKFRTDITQLDGSMANTDEFDAPTEQMRSVLPLFYQSGYLTIKGYDAVTDRYKLGYPNREVRQGVMRALAPYYVSDDSLSTANTIAGIYESLLDNQLEDALNRIKLFLSSIPYAEGATSEGHFLQLLYVMFSLMGQYMQTEVRTATGRMDAVWQTATDVYVFELKVDQPASKALEQIDAKGYMIPFTFTGRKLHKVGLSFSTKTRTIDDYIVA